MRKALIPAVALAVLAAWPGCRTASTRILIRSIPEQALVTDADQRRLGTTNLEISAPEGSMVSLVISKPGYRDKAITRKAEGGRMVIDAILVPVHQTTVRVELVPAHAGFSLFTQSGRALLEGKMADDYPLTDETLWQGAPQANRPPPSETSSRSRAAAPRSASAALSSEL